MLWYTLFYNLFLILQKKFIFSTIIQLIHATSTDNDLKWVRNEALKEKVCFIRPHTFTTLLNLVFFYIYIFYQPGASQQIFSSKRAETSVVSL